MGEFFIFSLFKSLAGQYSTIFKFLSIIVFSSMPTFIIIMAKDLLNDFILQKLIFDNFIMPKIKGSLTSYTDIS
jgi:hypothetical protein